jgi:acid stress-induced BolA-like protein IbaG/YrbA
MIARCLALLVISSSREHFFPVMIRHNWGRADRLRWRPLSSARLIAPMNAAEVQTLIQNGLPGAQVRVESDDDTHFEAVIIAPQFEGKRMIQRHQLVYATLGQLMGREIHALSIQAHSPSEQAPSEQQ